MRSPSKKNGPAADMHAHIARVARWFRIVRAVTLLQWLIFCGLVVVALWILADRLLYLGGHYALVVQSLASAVLLVLLGALLLIRIRPARIGYAVDHAAGLKNLVSSGLQAADLEDEVSRRVTERAADVLARQKPREVLPLRWAWPGRYTPVPCLVVVGALFLPQQDLLERKLRRDVAAAEQAQIEESALALRATLEAVHKNISQQDGIEVTAMTRDLEALTDALKTLDKKQALQKLGEFESTHSEALDEQRDFAKTAKSLNAATDPAGLSEQSRSQLEDLKDNLKNGDFAAAADALNKLAERLQDKALSTEERQAIAREMAKVASQLMPEGMNSELAKQLSEIASSTADIQDLMKACEKAAGDMKELAGTCSSCAGAKAMKDGLNDAKKAMLGSGFEGFDAKAVEDAMAAEAASARLGGMGNGNGTGGEGQGRGGNPPEAPTDTTFKDEFSASQLNKGKILHELFVAGVPEKGDARREYSDLMDAAREDAAGALARDKIPLEYETMVKQYFDSLNETKPQGGTLFRRPAAQDNP